MTRRRRYRPRAAVTLLQGCVNDDLLTDSPFEWGVVNAYGASTDGLRTPTS